MAKIAFVMPDASMVKAVHNAWMLHDKMFGKQQGLSYFVDAGREPENILSKCNYADVIVCRGGSATLMKEYNMLTPVVEIPMTSSDILAAIGKAVKQYGEMPVGVVGTANMIAYMNRKKNPFSFSVKCYEAKSIRPLDLMDAVDRAVGDGCELIIGGYETCRYSTEKGVKAELIHSSVESILLAITEAKRCANVSRIEKENSTIIRRVVEHASEGIISVDRNNIVRTFNPSAGLLLNRKPADIIGQPADRVLHKGTLLTILKNGQACTNEIVHIDGNRFVLNSMPLIYDNEHNGVMVTFQAAQTITSAESRLRKQPHPVEHTAKYHFDDIMGDSAVIHQTIRLAQKYAHADSTILLVGETGTGKELFAQSIHNESERCEGPFVAVNSAAIPEHLLESELFGYKGGAFTGANKNGKAGLFEAAHQGTIFLDEIGELPMTMQSRLLRVIQEREIRRIGDNRVIPIDVRIICATNRDLPEMIRKNLFREDLYYRLNVLNIRLPPLRERDGDAVQLLKHFLTIYAKRYGKGPVALTLEAIQYINEYRWPGNIREIRNISEQLAVKCEGESITSEDIESVLPVVQKEKPIKLLQKRSKVTERQQIIDALAATGSNKEAAKRLGISKSTFWRKCKQFGLYDEKDE